MCVRLGRGAARSCDFRNLFRDFLALEYQQLQRDGSMLLFDFTFDGPGAGKREGEWTRTAQGPRPLAINSVQFACAITISFR